MLDSRWYMETRATRPFETANRSQRVHVYTYMYMYTYIYRSCHKWNRIDSIHTAFGNRFFPFSPFFLPPPPPPPLPSSNTRRPIPVSLTNAYREYVGNFDALRSHEVSSSRCCENPIEVGTRYEDISKIFRWRDEEREKHEKRSPTISFVNPRSFVSLIR